MISLTDFVYRYICEIKLYLQNKSMALSRCTGGVAFCQRSPGALSGDQIGIRKIISWMGIASSRGYDRENNLENLYFSRQEKQCLSPPAQGRCAQARRRESGRRSVDAY